MKIIVHSEEVSLEAENQAEAYQLHIIAKSGQGCETMLIREQSVAGHNYVTIAALEK